MSVKTARWIAIGVLAVAAVRGQEDTRSGPVSGEVRRSAAMEADRPGRWALLLEEPPVAAAVRSRDELASPGGWTQQSRIESAQARVKAFLRERKIRELGSIQILENAVFVAATPEEARDLALLPGVRGVVPMKRSRRLVNRVADLVKASQGWQQVGGAQNAGAGMRIAIVDSGVDHTHPALNDNSLPAVSCTPGTAFNANQCAYTNRKIIVARSYVDALVYFYPEDTRPDDNSPRDRVGHGTALALIAGGAPVDAPIGRVQGIAPKAYLGSYKVFGSPGLNDTTFTDVVLLALEDAVRDRMDVATLSLGFAAEWGPDDAGAICNQAGNLPCDFWVNAVRNAIRLGLTVVAAAGNDGDAGQLIPSYTTINTPGTLPDVITVGATVNSHRVLQTLRVAGAVVPGNLQDVRGFFGDGPRPFGPISAPLRDVRRLDNNGQACEPLTNNSLTGAFALIDALGCTARTKVNNAQRAGAVGVVLMRAEGLNFVFPVQGLAFTGIPLFQVGFNDGKALRDLLASSPDRRVTLDPAWREVDNPDDADLVAYFTSYGPGIGRNHIKPELVAPGADIFTATQNLDPNGDMFDNARYTAVQGTSFSVPVVAAAVALVKQKNPGWGPVPLKSAVVNTATVQNVDDIDANGGAFPARVTAIGAGKLDLDAAMRTNITVDPPVVSFGVVGTTLPSRGLVFTNNGSAAVTLTLTARQRDADSSARVVISPASFSLAAGAQSQAVTVRLEGSRPNPGSYEGVITVEGGAVGLRIPYLYLVGDGVPVNVIPLRNFNFAGVVGVRLSGGLVLKVVDRFGVPVNGARVQWSPPGTEPCSGCVTQAQANTDELGINEASRVWLGANLGTQVFRAQVANLPVVEFVGQARLRPTIETAGVVNAADGTVGSGLAPGSYASIYGRGLSDIFLSVFTPYLPLSLAQVSVGFDVPGRQQSYPGRLHFVSDGQVNVQIPWELQGLTMARMKVSIGDTTSSAMYDLPLNSVSPAPFQYRETASGRDLAIVTTLTAELVSSAAPARRGQVYILYANGLGPCDNQPPSGEPSPAEPLARTRFPVEVRIGDRTAEILFGGLTPGSVGLYQINLRVPDGIPAGLQPLVITVNGISSKSVLIPIQ